MHREVGEAILEEDIDSNDSDSEPGLINLLSQKNQQIIKEQSQKQIQNIKEFQKIEEVSHLSELVNELMDSDLDEQPS